MSELSSEQKARIAARAATDRLAEDLVALDVRQVVSFTDILLICSGRSDRQVRAIADAVGEAAAECGERALGVEGYDEGRWVLMDLADVVVHVFQQDVRRHYDLERLWSDAPEVDLGLEGDDAARKVGP
jgi:ribosome-associated protein